MVQAEYIHWSHVALTLVVILFIRLSTCLPAFRESGKRRKRSKDDTASCMVVWGSGGHTTEMLRLIKEMNAERYVPMTFVLASSDSTSEGKILAHGCSSAKHADWVRIPRSREVKQSWVTSVFTTAYALCHSFLLVLRKRPEAIVCNGPGTCVPICLSGFCLRVLGICQPVIIFAESFCRVKTLSFTGKILYHVADRFIVQWPQLATEYPRAEYLGAMI